MVILAVVMWRFLSDGYMSKEWVCLWRALTRKGWKKTLTYLIGSWALRIDKREVKFHNIKDFLELNSPLMKALMIVTYHYASKFELPKSQRFSVSIANSKTQLNEAGSIDINLHKMIRRKFFRSVNIASEVCEHCHKTVIAFGRSLHECREQVILLAVVYYQKL